MKAKRIVSSTVPFLLITVLAMMIPAVSSADEVTALKVGVYNSRGVALAYGSSPAVEQQFKDLKTQHATAKAAGDMDTVRELEERGPWLQERLHMQVFGNLPVDDILEGREAMLAEVAREAGVVLIVSEVAYRLPYVQTVDVTVNIARRLGADGETLARLQEINTTEPVALPFDFSDE